MVVVVVVVVGGVGRWWWRGVVWQKDPLPKIYHTYPTMMKLGNFDDATRIDYSRPS